MQSRLSDLVRHVGAYDWNPQMVENGKVSKSLRPPKVTNIPDCSVSDLVVAP